MEPIAVIPKSVNRALRLEGAAIAIAAVAAYGLVFGNWWLFALLLLLPDLSFLAIVFGQQAAIRAYNVAHNYVLPIALGGVGYFGGFSWMAAAALIWIVHIGGDRALGYGLKYPTSLGHTHLGLIGKARKAANPTE